MASQLVDIADLDCIYLSYDEPQKEEFWVQIQNIVPWAKRVDGVQGSDAAHKAAAAISDTERFILIDGDNIPDSNFFDIQLDIKSEYTDCVFRWKARNHINGLMYGNGGLSCWTREFVNNMQTHESSDGTDATVVEFCFDDKYIPLNNVYSTTYPNGSAKHAFRAGFREGVKMCLSQGTKPTVEEFKQQVHAKNFDKLCVWQSVGADAEFGYEEIYGARYGTYKLMFTDWDWHQVRDFASIDNIWEAEQEFLQFNFEEYGAKLRRTLELPIADYNSDQSKFFKHYYSQTYHEYTPMTTELEVIRKAEGW
jgi:hypothetical protein